MAAPKMTMALASLLLSGVFAVTPYSDSQSTVTAEPQQIGTTTSNGILMYSMNYCTIVESTQCQVSLSTATNAVPESSAGYSASVDSTTQAVSAVGQTVISSGEPAPTTVWSDSAPGAPQPTATVVSVTDSLGSPALETDSVLAATGSTAITSGMPMATGSATGKQQTNSTSVMSHDSPSGSMTAPSAPDHTSAGVALKAISGLAFGTLAMVMTFFM
ncbi:uncharacterized protein TRIVIDRAFT_220753 [Trichoderma virens Gv29-8]|uniref:Uncharacterized protein n=1 Tax=Hypocrea virens (strain Gv29-8 / FGSC 10586) TaxID=413071 RepID=G9MNN4_HYPVG|nr:uncharacterized protein TRIVIDRAFT_220753 [Trichoderma virens Gv29-8]EHK23489.1 hypothetical protein TRIVIDRAFT_220753 [Trichoderma virens Gv29-8]